MLSHWKVILSSVRSAFTCCYIGVFCSVANQAIAGAWVQEPGSSEFITTILYSSAISGYDDLGNLTEVVEFSKLETAVYGEYGLIKNWSIVGRVSYQEISLQRNLGVDAGKGIGASNIALKYKFGQIGQWLFSSQAGVLIPGGTENGLDLRLGEGGTEWEFRILTGRPFKTLGKDGFVDIQIARQFRSSVTPDELKVDFTVGFYPKQNIMLMGQVFGVIGDKPRAIERRKLESLKIQGSLVWFLRENSGVQFFASRPVSGRNVIADTAIGIGWWSRF
ncbi:MAG: hypothetical protein JKY46_06815 [Robiginitomaculum sp.]|nr:hypothetical protein [Robiginitomaculum sp.]